MCFHFIYLSRKFVLQLSLNFLQYLGLLEYTPIFSGYINSSCSFDSLKRTDKLHTLDKKAVILLSGGLDSTTTLAIAKSAGYTCYALSFSYGQRNKHELNSAKLVAESTKVERHIILNSDLSIFGGAALTSDIAVPKGRTEEELSHGVPVTYVPARNTVFLSLALALVEVL